MFVKSNKSVLIALLALFLLIIVPISFAADNNTEILSYETDNVTKTVSIPIEDNVLTASNDYYFDASAENDGDGSISNPYKYLKADRIRANSNLYLANGEYNLDKLKSIEEVNIIGNDVDKTIIKYDGVAFSVNNQFTVKNITFIGASITNKAKFTASNVVFEDGYGSKPDSYGNNWGGAIYTQEDSYNTNIYVNVDNCTFKNNYAVYGGAIYMAAGSLNVSNSLFFNNLAYNYGGAIACDYASGIYVSKSKFYSSRSLADAGGSIYIRQSSKFVADNIEIVNSSSTFGGAITTLNTTSSINHAYMDNNSAKYDGGAIFHMYGEFSISYSTFNNNSAMNGGAIFIDNSTNAIFMRNTFTNNIATSTGGAIYSILNKLNAPFPRFNTFQFNTAVHESNYQDVSSLNLTIGNGNYTMYKTDADSISSIPVKYSLVDDGYVTKVKDQQSSGNCWAFTAIAVLESCILKATGENLDLSEENMKNIIELYSDYGWKMDTNNGGYDYMPWGYLASWLGPVDEMDDLFDDKSTLSPILNSIMHVQNIKFLKRSSFTDNDEIKRAILNYGAVGTGIYYDYYYLNYENYGYYCWYTTSGNHAVTIVGWDDTYSKYNFKYGSTISGDGAWIVRNSWDSSWGNNGYFYVSYYDANFARPGDEASAYTFILNDTIRFDKNYQYDIAGMTDYFFNTTSNVLYKNKFTATSDEYLAAISTYFYKTTNWTATVLVNNEIKDVLSGISNSGYYTFNLNKFIQLKSGDVFEVVFNITSSGDVGFPISEVFSLNKLVYSPGVSYASWDGEKWFDLYNFTGNYSTHSYNSGVACIKAFTYLNPIKTLTDLSIDFKWDCLSNITAAVHDEFGNSVKYGNITFNINGENQTVGVVNGLATLSYDLNKKINLISASFEGMGYNSSSNMTTYVLPKIEMAWNLSVVQFFNSVNLTVSANKLINENIIMDINGENIPFKLINGCNTLTLSNLTNDLYNVHVSLQDDSDYSADILSDEFVIDMHNTKIISSNLNTTDDGLFAFNITLLDENDNPLANKEIIFTVNNDTYRNATDNDGQAIIYIKLDKGVYDIESSFEGDNNYFASNTSGTINVKGKIWINLNVNTYDNNAFINVYGSNRINETFTVLVNNKPYTVNSKYGVATLELFNLANDVYDVKVSLNESEYEFNEVESQFTININDNVEINSSIELFGDDAVIKIGIGNVSGNVNVIVDGNANIIKLVEGKAYHTVKNISPGNHSVVIVYRSNNIKSEIFDVPKKESNIELSFNNTKIGEKATISINTTPKNTGLVSIDVNGTSYLVNLSETNTLDLMFEDIGNYSIVATYLGDDEYESSESQQYQLTVSNKKMANISIDVPQDIKVGDEILIDIVSDSNAELIVSINGEVQSIIYANSPLKLSLSNIIKATNGKVKYVPLKEGIYNITVITAENEEYASEIATKVFGVTKKEAMIEISPIDDVKVGDKITISVKNKTDGALTVKVNDEKVTGEYEITKSGIYTVTVESTETDEYKAKFATYAFNVVEEPMEQDNITVIVDGKEYSVEIVNGTASVTTDNNESDNDVTVVVDGVAYPVQIINGTVTIVTNRTEPVVQKASDFGEITIGDDLSISILLKDEDGNAISDALIIYSVNGKVNTVSTDENGKFVIAGENSALITISYDGNANIVGTNTTLKLNSPAVPAVVKVDTHFDIENRAITINGYAVDGDAGEQGIYYATRLLDANGKPLSNVYMEFAVNNKIYKRTTNENGSFNPYQLNMIRAGRYTMAFNFAGDDNYTNAFACVCVDLDKKPITIKAPAKSYKASVKTKKYTVSLSTVPSVHDGKVYLSPKHVTLKVNGKTYNGKTNSKGQVTFKITNLSKKGKYVAKISVKGDKTYEDAVKSVKLTVK